MKEKFKNPKLLAFAAAAAITLPAAGSAIFANEADPAGTDAAGDISLYSTAGDDDSGTSDTNTGTDTGDTGSDPDTGSSEDTGGSVSDTGDAGDMNVGSGTTDNTENRVEINPETKEVTVDLYGLTLV